MNMTYWIALAVASVLVTQSTRAGQLLYLASTEEKTIVAHQIDEETGLLKKKWSVDTPGKAGPLAYSPSRSFVYAAVTGLEGGKAGVAT